MKVYVAGAYVERDRVQRVMGQLEQLRCTITLDWTTKVREFSSGADWEVSTDERRRRAGLMREAIAEADWFILLVPSSWSNGRGAFVEWGIASEMHALKPHLIGRYRNHGPSRLVVAGGERYIRVCSFLAEAHNMFAAQHAEDADTTLLASVEQYLQHKVRIEACGYDNRTAWLTLQRVTRTQLVFPNSRYRLKDGRMVGADAWSMSGYVNKADLEAVREGRLVPEPKQTKKDEAEARANNHRIQRWGEP